MANVVLRNVVKRFGNKQVINGINIDIASKDFIVIVGPSGCGKTTTLRLIAGLEKVTGGDILIGNHKVNNIPPKERDVAMVFQNYALYPHMNVFENMAFALKLRKIPKKEIVKRVTDTARILEIEELLTRKADKLSGGQAQRVAIGRAIVRNPLVFLYDEPLSNLDPELRTKMRTEIKQLHRKVQKTVIYVTHDQVEAMTLADRIVVMREGRIEQEGNPFDIFYKPENIFVAQFFGSPSMNLFPAKIDKFGSQYYLNLNYQLKVLIPAKYYSTIKDRTNVFVGLRAEDITLNTDKGKFPAEWQVNGIVKIVEQLGSETIIHLNIQGINAIGKIYGQHNFNVEERIELSLNLDHLHIFDSKSKLSIS